MQSCFKNGWEGIACRRLPKSQNVPKVREGVVVPAFFSDCHLLISNCFFVENMEYHAVPERFFDLR